ncbi:hypothetical protein ACFC0R_14390 [Streptomyces sp. NPDC056086]|uniref:hypothetical protein n=1 Tax=Streptomyces sp. NPDC056086 TaxID=3345709 RepID=UPI0035E39F00
MAPRRPAAGTEPGAGAPAHAADRALLPPCGFLAPAVRPGPPCDAGTDPPAARTHTPPAQHWTEAAGHTADAAGPTAWAGPTAHAVGPAHAADRLPDQPRRAAEASRHHARHRVHGTG